MGEKFTPSRLERFYELNGIWPDQIWPFPDEFIERDRVKYFIGIDWSGNGNDVQRNGRIERPVFYVARGTTRPYMACIKPEKTDGTRYSKYRDKDSIEKMHEVATSKELWYNVIDQLKLPDGTKMNDGFNTHIITNLLTRISADRELPFSKMGIIIDGWLNETNQENIVKKLKMKDKRFSMDNILARKNADREVRIVSSADCVAYYLREHYIETGKMLRPDRRVFVGDDL